ncbi:MAG: four helix bundle protein [Bacteroidota bacterium]
MSDLDLVEDREARYGVTERFKRFVLQVWAFCETVPSTATGRNVVFQLTKSASSTGANFRAAFRARSDKEYLAKLGIAEEEGDETCYWLDLIRSYEKWDSLHESAEQLYHEADQLTAIIVSLIKRKKDTLK